MTDTGASHVVVLSGDAVGADVLAGLVATRADVDVLDVVDELRVAVAALALASTADVGPSAAHQALARLRVVELDDPVTVLGVGEAVDNLRVSADGPVESLTVLVRDAGRTLDALSAYLADHHPDVEPTVVGPTGRGPAVLIGLD